MISIIICSRKPDISFELKSNIAVTIGIAYELIVIDNSDNKYSIFSAYNEGVRRAKFPYLCFMHEDILYHSNSWGEHVNKQLLKKENGLIGVIGGRYLADYPSTWFSTEYTTGKILQGTKGNDNRYNFMEDVRDYDFEDTKEVCAVDGLWFCIRKELFEKISFDKKRYNKWHAYDIDICVQIYQLGYKLLVTNKILIEHKSYGNTNKDFYLSLIIFYFKWKKYLPISVGLDLSKQHKIEIRNSVKKKFLYNFKRCFKTYFIIKRIMSV